MNNAIALMHVNKRYGEQVLLDDVTLLLPKNGFIAIEGPSGSGKSTLLSLLTLQQVPDSGDIYFGEEEVSSWGEERKRDFRFRHMGFICQKEELIQAENALWNVSLPSLCLEDKNASLHKAKSYLHRLGLGKKEESESSSLSGGEKQRIHIARALMMAPEYLFADEPTSALDPEKAEEVMTLLKRLSKTRLVVVVSHDGKRLRRYADRLYRLEGGKLHELPLLPFDPPSPLLLKPVEAKTQSVKLPLTEHLLHAKRKKKVHRIRAMMIEASLSLGLFGVGMASYLSSSIQDQISSSFAKIVPPNTIAMEKAAQQESLDARIASKEEAGVLLREFPEEIVESGKVYLYDFESSFPDDRFFYYRVGVSEKMLPSFSARSINDVLPMPIEAVTHPQTIGELSSSEVVLGLPFETMAMLCRDFGLAKGYGALGRKLEQDPLNIEFRLSSLRWGLEESLMLEAVGVIESPLPLLYHQNPRWNESIFEGAFAFRDVGGEAPSNPQETQSIPFIRLRGSPSSFLKKARSKETTEQFLFDYPTSNINPSFCVEGKTLQQDRLYLYVSSTRGISPYVFDQVMDASPTLVGRLPSCPGGYFASVESALAGFAGRFFLAKDETDVQVLEDTYADLPLEQAGLLGTMPKHCVEGSVLSSGSGGLFLSADLSWMKTPLQGIEEVAMSEGLFRALGQVEEVYVLAETSSEKVGNTISRTFRKAKVRVKEVRKEEKWSLYVPSDWTIDFYVDALQCSPLSFEATGAMFFLSKEKNEQAEAKRLEGLFPGYRFASPSALVESSLSETTSYVSIVLAIFSAVALLTSALLFAFVFCLSFLEGKKEAHALEVLGLSEKEIARFHEFTIYLYIGNALLASIMALLLSHGLVALFLSRAFSSSFSFSLSFLPFGLILLLGLFFALLMKVMALAWKGNKRGGRNRKVTNQTATPF